MLRLIISSVFMYLVFRFVRALLRVLLSPGPPAQPAGEMMEQDPQCGIYIPRNEAVTLRKKGKTIYFCSHKCRDDWKKIPPEKKGEKV